MDGRVIAFEGIDGSGKGVQIREIAGRLNGLGRKVLVQDFPVYSGFFGKEIGRMLSGEQDVRADVVDPRSMSLWYALDRHEALKGIDRREYDDILFNRSTLSNAVYQSIRTREEDREAFIEWLFELEFERLGVWEPDLYFIFDVTEEQSKKNVEKKEQRAYLKDTFDVYERSQRIMNQARSVYLRLAQEYDNMYIIPCMDENGVFKSIEEIADLVMKKIMEK
ncbi:MAG: hypothetical protein HFI15_17395 [Lachnospiraceae bacterium]|jgi:dTMP kinase|nr:hypothetical protein [Lachnospiraceae bacterium]